jgi:hypothetical protein
VEKNERTFDDALIEDLEPTEEDLKAIRGGARNPQPAIEEAAASDD